MFNLTFIKEEEFTAHVTATILKYADKLASFDLTKLNKNTIDPIKLIFDKMVYGISWEEMIQNETFRQRDKSNNNDIGYFHQNIFAYFNNCVVPESGWDVIFTPETQLQIAPGRAVSRIYVELKNKHNTMNSAAAGKTFMKMQDQLLSDDDSACFLVEAIAKKSQNIEWKPRVDGKLLGNNCIRRVSLDQFYAIVTGEKDAFYQVCATLPTIIKNVIQKQNEVQTPNDTVFHSLNTIAKKYKKPNQDSDLSFAVALYLLAFPSYNGFKDIK